MSTVSPAHVREFRDRGFIIARALFSKDEARALLSEVERCAALDPPTALTASGIVYTGSVFNRSEITRRMLVDPRVLALLTPVAGGDLWIRLDQAVRKDPGAGDFRWHQDNGYNKLKREHYQIWIALTETSHQNGALKLAPGSHRRGLLPHRYVGSGQLEVQAEVGETVTIDADIGDVILFSSLTLHATGPNLADRYRTAYVAEYVRLEDYEPNARPPFFVACRGGIPTPHFTLRKPGAYSIRNQLMYLGPRLEEAARRPLHRLKQTVKAAIGRRPADG